MLSEYRDLLEKRRLERKRGHNPVPELPPFVPLPKGELAQVPPSSPASFDYGPYFAQEPITLSRRSPSVYSRQSVNASPPPPARSRSIITPPPLAISIANTLENDQRSSPQRPSYLSQLAPFSVTPRKRLFAETTLITVEESTADGDEAQPNKRVQSPSVTREYPGQSPIAIPADADQASIPEKEHVNNTGDVDMMDTNTHNTIPDKEQPLSPVIEENDIVENLSVHELSIHEESLKEDEPHNTPPATANSPQENRDSEHHTTLLVEPQQQIAKESPQEQNESQQGATKDSSQEPSEPRQQMSEDDAEETKQVQDETPGSVELQESVLQENVEKPAYVSAYQTVIDKETQDNLDGLQQETGESIEAATAKVTDQTATNGHASETENPVDPATDGNPIKYGFDDDNIDYGGYDDVYQGDEGKPAASMSQAGDQAEEDTPNNVLRDLRTMATANTVNLKKIKKMSNLHIQTISNLVLDSTKEARNNTTDAHEKSIIEDYYYTVNDDLKKCHKHYLQYQQCASANRRLKAYHRKKDLQFLNVIKEEGILKRRIHYLRQEIAELDTKQDTWTRIEDLFHDINQIKDTCITTVTKQLTTEVLVHVASFLDLASILQFSMTGKSYSYLIKNELLFKQLNKRDFRVSEKSSGQTWLDMYKQLNDTDVVMADTSSSSDPSATEVSQIAATPTEASQATTAPTQQPTLDTNTQPTTNTTEITPATSNFNTQETATDACPHFEPLTEVAREVKKILFKSEEAYLCDLCSNNPAAYLSMHHDDHTGACLSCLTQPSEGQQAHYPIQLELVTGDVYCFKCHPGKPRKLDAARDGQIIQDTIAYIRESESMEDLEKRRKTEQALYVQELRREDLSLKHYLVEKQWGRTWMSFRTREGAPLPTKITQSRLSRSNGTLDPNIRLPMDKYRPCPETHGDIVSEKLWRYLAKAYGVQGRAYSEDDIIAPEYARIRVYVDDYKKSIHLYP
ncbi:hypothetical protein MAM1_0051c03395 [Mucor ambiguus]|uniref:DUSP domain-containing protein n=1 Tax=Mucor ambiguus TaxID=91626 RepID=A0A0C9M9J0_9FUNG|nr:hypothetical protein MAM1_0051c03395 [Mucor ambiguus]